MNKYETMHDQIDLIGLNQQRAVSITHEKLNELKCLLEESKISPNHSKTDHIFKVIAHAGKHSRYGVGVLKFAIDDLLKEMQCDYYRDMNNGVFLVRIKVKKI